MNWLRSFIEGIKNCYKFFNVVWRFRSYDYQYSLDIFDRALSLLAVDIYNGVTESKNAKYIQILRCISVIRNIKDDEVYLEWAEKKLGKFSKGFNDRKFSTDGDSYVFLDTRTPEEIINDRKIIELATEYEEKDFDMFIRNIKDIKTWWN